jgi:hypothetical protein
MFNTMSTKKKKSCVALYEIAAYAYAHAEIGQSLGKCMFHVVYSVGCQWFMQDLNSTNTIRFVRNIVVSNVHLTHMHLIYQVPNYGSELIPLGPRQLLWKVLFFNTTILWAISTMRDKSRIYQF